MSNRIPPVPSSITGDLGYYLNQIVQRLNNESFVSQSIGTFSVVHPGVGGTVALSGDSVVLTAKNVLLGSVITSTSTVGFPQMPSSEATPTGTPAQMVGASGGYVPFCYNRTHHRLFVYDTQSNTWRSVALS